MLKQARTPFKERSLIQLFKGLGYVWEERRQGQLRLGLVKWALRKGEPLKSRAVFVPGFGDSPFPWMLAQMLAGSEVKRRFDEVVFLDFPGFAGALSEAPAFPSMDLLSDAVFGALDSLRPEWIIGHSLGGWLTARYLVRLSQGHTGPLGYTGPQEALLICPSGVLSGEKEREAWREKFEAAKRGEFERFRKYVFHREPLWFWLAEKGFKKFFQKPEIQAFIASVREDHLITQQDLQGVRTHVNLMWGQEDQLNPLHWSQAWLDALPSSELHVLEGVGHTVHLEQPRKTAAKLRQLLPKRSR